VVLSRLPGYLVLTSLSCNPRKRPIVLPLTSTSTLSSTHGLCHMNALLCVMSLDLSLSFSSARDPCLYHLVYTHQKICYQQLHENSTNRNLQKLAKPSKNPVRGPQKRAKREERFCCTIKVPGRPLYPSGVARKQITCFPSTIKVLSRQVSVDSDLECVS